jgi:hypothetical protein
MCDEMERSEDPSFLGLWLAPLNFIRSVLVPNKLILSL